MRVVDYKQTVQQIHYNMYIQKVLINNKRVLKVYFKILLKGRLK